MYLKKREKSTNRGIFRFHGETENAHKKDKRLPEQALVKEYEEATATRLK